MKKILFCTIVLFLVLTASVFASRNAIDEVIQAYEAIVIETENVAKMPLIAASDFTALQEKADDAIQKIEAIENEKEWVIRDALDLADLNFRFNQAMTAIAKKLLQY